MCKLYFHPRCPDSSFNIKKNVQQKIFFGKTFFFRNFFWQKFDYFWKRKFSTKLFLATSLQRNFFCVYFIFQQKKFVLAKKIFQEIFFDKHFFRLKFFFGEHFSVLRNFVCKNFFCKKNCKEFFLANKNFWQNFFWQIFLQNIFWMDDFWRNFFLGETFSLANFF